MLITATRCQVHGPEELTDGDIATCLTLTPANNSDPYKIFEVADLIRVETNDICLKDNTTVTLEIYIG